MRYGKKTLQNSPRKLISVRNNLKVLSFSEISLEQKKENWLIKMKNLDWGI